MSPAISRSRWAEEVELMKEPRVVRAVAAGWAGSPSLKTLSQKKRSSATVTNLHEGRDDLAGGVVRHAASEPASPAFRGD